MDETERLLQAASFGAVVEAYDRARPTYPDPAIDWLLPPDARRMLDLGAGTGKLTRSLVARGLDTIAVDPSVPMLDRLRERLPAVAAYQGTAEAIPLDTASVDAAIVAQAWHWVDPARAVPEVGRVIAPGGTLGLMWNTRDAGVDWVGRLNTVIDRGDPSPDTYTAKSDIGVPFGSHEHRSFRWSYTLDETMLLDLVASRSFMITLPVADRAALFDAVRDLFRDVSGGAGTPTIALPYVTRCYRFRREADM